MTRPERRRAQREAESGRPTKELLRDLNGQRKLQHDHTEPGGKLCATTEEDGWEAINCIRRSGVMPYLDRKVPSRTGVPSKLTPLVLLAAALLAAQHPKSALISDMARVIAGLDAGPGWELGICTADGWVAPGYKATAKQWKRLRSMLLVGWTDPDGTRCNLEWVKKSMIQASITEDVAWRATAGAVDSTAVRAWHTAYDDPDGGPPISVDHGASHGYRSRSSAGPAGIFFGRDLHLLTLSERPAWTGDPNRALFTDHVPRFIVDMHMNAAGANAGPIGHDLVMGAKEWIPGLDTVGADRGYSDKKGFTTPLHKENIHVIMDLHPYAVAGTKVRDVGRGKSQRLIENAGLFFSEWTPDKFLAPPKGLKDKELQKWYADRYKYSWTVVQRFLPGGGLKARCPQCGKHIRTKAKTPKPKKNKTKKKAPETGQESNTGTEAPKAGRVKKAEKKKGPVPVEADIGSDQYCCKGRRVDIPVEYRQRSQDFPYGTRSWESAYHTLRNKTENSNKELKNNFGLLPGWCRSPCNAAYFLGALFLVVAQNLKICLELARSQTGPENPAGNRTGTAPGNRTGTAPGAELAAARDETPGPSP